MAKVIIEGKEYNCFAPEECITPKGTFIESIEQNILIRNNYYILAKIHYRGEQEGLLYAGMFLTGKKMKKLVKNVLVIRMPEENQRGLFCQMNSYKIFSNIYWQNKNNFRKKI